jgi:THO complex subunit 2
VIHCHFQLFPHFFPFSYKQNKVNLLREQSEGYSKLATELTSNVGPPHSPATGRSIESSLSIHARARQVWERVVSLIGHFDLDPNRALDILLDVFSTHLATHYTFFLSLLSYSPWAPTKSSHDGTDVGCESNDKSKDLDEVLLMAELRSNRKLQSDASRGAGVLAQVLGFKFVHYQACLQTLLQHNLLLSLSIQISLKLPR